MHNPETREELQEAADAAQGLLAIHTARQYGLAEGGPIVNVDRCQEVLELAAEQRIRPRLDSIDRLVRELAEQHV